MCDHKCVVWFETNKLITKITSSHFGTICQACRKLKFNRIVAEFSSLCLSRCSFASRPQNPPSTHKAHCELSSLAPHWILFVGIAGNLFGGAPSHSQCSHTILWSSHRLRHQQNIAKQLVRIRKDQSSRTNAPTTPLQEAGNTRLERSPGQTNMGCCSPTWCCQLGMRDESRARVRR